MNAMTNHILQPGSWWCATVSLTAMAVMITPAGAQEVDDDIQVVAVEVQKDEEGENKRTVVIRVEDGDVSVEVDGEPVPEAQIMREEDRIIIQDKDGKVIEEVRLRHRPGHQPHRNAWIWNWDDEDGWLYGALDEEAPKVMLGIQMTRPGPALEHHLGLEPNTATMISGVYEGLPAHAAGLSEFDLITRIDGQAPADAGAIGTALQDKEPGHTLTLTVIQNGETKEMKVELAAYDRKKMSESKLLGGGAGRGFWMAPDGVDWRQHLRGMAVPPDADARVFVVPDAEDIRRRVEHLAPRIREEVREHVRDRALDLRDHGNRLEEQLEQLNDRLNEMEETLQKLLEDRATDE